MQESMNKIEEFYNILKRKYGNITEERKAELAEQMDKYGYLPYPYIKALDEISDAETLFCLEKKWEKEGVYVDGKFHFSDFSVLAKNNVQTPDWIKREGHDIKLINLLGLGNGNKDQKEVSFFDWLRQIIILPTGNKENNITNTTIYLTPFHPRGFGCAYIPQASCADPLLEDKSVLEEAGLNADEQVKMFIFMSQLAGHPVIYDILPQTGRYSKTVLVNPSCVRWFDINFLIKKICSALDSIWDDQSNKVLSSELLNKYSKEDIDQAIAVYKKFLSGERKFELSDRLKEIITAIDKDSNMRKYKKSLSKSMQNKNNQITIQQKVKNIVSKCTGLPADEITEDDIKDRKNAELMLIKDGLWSLPGGAWNSAGVPVFDKMAKNGLYPIMRHYNYQDEDVSINANLDCQSPFYFVYLESGEYNKEVIDFYIKYVKNLVKEFNFDGVRIDHVNHVVDEMSVKDGLPISYRIPEKVLKALNDELKTISPYFAVMAEYMLNQDNIKEYHNMNFDIFYGNDIIFQCYKTPQVIDADNMFIGKYNRGLTDKPQISVLKTYNNQDGEFKYINMYPAQLGREGALFKWFKYKFLPGGYYAPRPIMYVDGDESFSQGGIEETICNEVFMKRNDDLDFYSRFDAIDRFAKNNNIVCYGEAHILKQEDDGFVYWQIQTNDTNNFIIAAANYHSPKEYFPKENNDKKEYECKIGQEVVNKTIKLHEGYVFTSEYKFNGTDYEEEDFDMAQESLVFERLMPAEFRFFRVQKIN